MLKRVKRSGLRWTRALGLQRVVAESRWRRRRLLILCYHGISRTDEHLWRPSLFMRPGMLRQRMEGIRRGGFRVLRLQEGLHRLRAGTLPPKSLVLTFDDGELGFYTHAWPILREFDYPVTVYASTYYVERRLPVVTLALSYLLWSGRGGRATADLPHLGSCEIDASGARGRTRTYSTLMRRMEEDGLDSEAKNDVLRGLSCALRVDWDGFRERRTLELMSPAEIRELAGQGVDFQLHTHRHRLPDDRQTFVLELAKNREVLRRCTGGSPDHFCYPSGEYNARAKGWLREEAIASATTCDPGLASEGSDLLLLPRLVDVPTLSTVEFEAWLSGVAVGIPRLPSRMT